MVVIRETAWKGLFCADYRLLQDVDIVREIDYRDYGTPNHLNIPAEAFKALCAVIDPLYTQDSAVLVIPCFVGIPTEQERKEYGELIVGWQNRLAFYKHLGPCQCGQPSECQYNAEPYCRACARKDIEARK